MRRGVLVVVWLASFATYLGAGAVADLPVTGDEPHYLRLALSLLLDGDVDIANDVASEERTIEVIGAPYFDPHGQDYRGDGTLRSVHGVGTAVAVLPAVAVARALDLDLGAAARTEVAAIAATAAVALLVLVRRWTAGGRPLASWLAWGSVAVAVPLLPHATQVYPEVPALLLIVVALVALTRQRSAWSAATVGTCAAALPWFHSRYLPIAAGLLVAEVVRQRRDRLAVAAAVVPVAASLLAMAYFHQRWYGEPWPTAAYAAEGLGDYTISARRLWYEGIGLFLSASTGWFTFAPIAALALCAAAATAVRRRSLPFWIVAAGFGAYALLVGATGQQGQSLPGRLVVVLVPVAAFGASRVLVTSGRLRDTAEVLVGLTAGIAVLSPLAGVDLYDHASQNHAPVASAAAGAFPTLTWDPDGPFGFGVDASFAPAQTGRLEERDDTTVRVVEEGIDEPGLLSYGPYAPTVPARWEARYRMRVTGAPTGDVVCLDATTDGGAEVLATRCVDRPDRERDEYVLTFDTAYQLVEVRALWNGTGTVELAGIDVVPTEDLRPDRGWPYVVAWLLVLAAATAYLVRRRI